jgi:glutaconate CoA-transferase subunit B
VVTPLCVFRFDPVAKTLRVESLHPEVSPEELQSKTGFPVEVSSATPITPAPTTEQLKMLRERVRPQVAKVYPVFARSAFLAA